MLIYLLRHGLTEYNAEKRYQGQRDIPLSAAGRAMLCRADISPQNRVHHSPFAVPGRLLRCCSRGQSL